MTKLAKLEGAFSGATVSFIRRERARRSLYDYLKQSWPTMEPGYVFKDNWHIGAICEHLQAVSDGEIKRLIVNIPPRHCKSSIISVAWPTWDWIDNPHRQFLFASYAAQLSIRDAVKSRRLINSPWYQDNFGDGFSLSDDQNQKTRYSNDQNGYRVATSVGGQLTGDGADFVCCDDPNSATDAESEAVRESTLDWWDQVIPTRLNDPKNGAFVVIQQRLHTADITGHILAHETGWDHLVFPARYERSPIHPVKSSLGFKDPRKKEGELLWPEHFGEKEISALEARLGSYGTAGQLQQRPAPAGGGLIKRDHFKLWPHANGLPQCSFIVQSYDTAFTDKTTGDPTACTTWGVFKPNINPANKDPAPWSVIMLDGWSEHLLYPDLRRKAISEYNTEYGDPARLPDVVLIEDKGSGQALKVDLSRAGVPVRTYNPYKADKTARVQIILPLLEAGRVYLPESQHRPDEPCSWCEPLLRECMFFPKAEHDDLVDTMTQVLIMLHDSALLKIDEDVDDWDNAPKERVNPYAV